MYSKTTRDAVKFEVEKYTISRFGFVLNVVQSDTIDPVTNSNDILGSFSDEIDTDSVIDLNISVETPTAIRNKTTNTSNKLLQNNDIQLAPTQPAHNVPGTSPEGPLKVVTSGTYREPSGDQYKN